MLHNYYNFDNQSLIPDIFRMMNLIPIKVESYSGYKADEYPKSFPLNDRFYEIIEITDRWYQGYIDPDVPASDYFRVKIESGDQYLIKHDLEENVWYLC